MKNNNDVVQALYDQIKNDSAVLEGGYKVEKDEYVNHLPNKCPWVGVYKGEIIQKPGSLGRNSRSWGWTSQAIVVIQASHGLSGEKCSERLCEYEKTVLDAIWSDPQLGGEIDQISGIKTVYSYSEKDSKSLYYQMATITLTLEAQTG